MTSAPRSTIRAGSRLLAAAAAAVSFTLTGCAAVGAAVTPAAAPAAPVTRAVVGAPPTAGAPATAGAPSVEAPSHVFTIGEAGAGTGCQLTGDFTLTTPGTGPVNPCGADARRCARARTGQLVHFHNGAGRDVTVFFDPFARKGHPVARGQTVALHVHKDAFGRSPEPKTFTFFVSADDKACGTLDPKIIVEN